MKQNKTRTRLVSKKSYQWKLDHQVRPWKKATFYGPWCEETLSYLCYYNHVPKWQAERHKTSYMTQNETHTKPVSKKSHPWKLDHGKRPYSMVHGFKQPSFTCVIMTRYQIGKLKYLTQVTWNKMKPTRNWSLRNQSNGSWTMEKGHLLWSMVWSNPQLLMLS